MGGFSWVCAVYKLELVKPRLVDFSGSLQRCILGKPLVSDSRLTLALFSLHG